MWGFGDLGKAIAGMFIVAACAGAAFAAALIFGVPWLWSWIKPWLHMATA